METIRIRDQLRTEALRVGDYLASYIDPRGSCVLGTVLLYDIAKSNGWDCEMRCGLVRRQTRYVASDGSLVPSTRVSAYWHVWLVHDGVKYDVGGYARDKKLCERGIYDYDVELTPEEASALGADSSAALPADFLRWKDDTSLFWGESEIGMSHETSVRLLFQSGYQDYAYLHPTVHEAAERERYYRATGKILHHRVKIAAK